MTSLEQYPRPSVAVDTAVLTVIRDSVAVMLVQQEGDHRLPGTFLRSGEVLADAVRRSLREKAGVEGLRPEQLRVFDSLGRDDRGWVLSVAHVDVVPASQLPVGRFTLRSVDDAVGLPFDHDEIVRIAVERVRGRYREHPDPDRLLPDDFTLRHLQLLHEAVAGTRLPRDGFRRGMEPRLEPTGRLSSGSVGKPARLWRHPR